MKVLAYAIVEIIFQCINVSNYPILHLKLIQYNRSTVSQQSWKQYSEMWHQGVLCGSTSSKLVHNQ